MLGQPLLEFAFQDELDGEKPGWAPNIEGDVQLLFPPRKSMRG
jgi:hypothetical protein